MFMDIILFGIQGSGKGTQARLLAEKYNYKIFETGQELRNIIKGGSELGKKVNDFISKGNLVTNEIVMEIVENFLEKNKEDKIIFDGIPRSLLQKKTMDDLLKRNNRDCKIIFLEVPKNEVLERMQERGREDDTEEIIKRRIENYENETIPVIEQYKGEKEVFSIDGFKSIDKVFKNLCATIQK